jgi:hypothetical protein
MGTVWSNFKTPQLETSRKPTCELVLEHFKLPPLRLLSFFDDVNPVDFDKIIGPFFCGFHACINGGELDWPPYVKKLLRDRTGNYAYDNVIYINGRTCASLPGSIITFAHELQHFTQCGYMRKVWLANTLIYNILYGGPPTTIKGWDIPYERDAMKVSKHVAEKVLGEDVVKAHAEAQIVAGNDPEKWKFFLSVSNSTPFNLLAETKLWVEKYRTELMRTDQGEVDFAHDEWWSESMRK